MNEVCSCKKVGKTKKLIFVLAIVLTFATTIVASGVIAAVVSNDDEMLVLSSGATKIATSLTTQNTDVIAEGEIMGFYYRVVLETFNDSGTWSDSSSYYYNDSYDWSWAYEDVMTFFNTSQVSNVRYSVYKEERSEDWWTYYSWIGGYGLNQSTGDAPSVPDWDWNGYYVLNLTEEIANLTYFALSNGGNISIQKIKLDWPGAFYSLNGTWLGDDNIFNYDWNITVIIPNYNFTDPYTNTSSLMNLYITEYWSYSETFIPESAIQTALVNVTQVNSGYSISNGTYTYKSNYNASYAAFSVEIWQPDGNFFLTYYAPLSWEYSSTDYNYYQEYFEYNYTSYSEVVLLEDVPGIGNAGDLVPYDLLPDWLRGSYTTYSKGYRESEYNSTGSDSALTAMQYIGMGMWAVPQPLQSNATLARAAGFQQQDTLAYTSVYWDNFIPAVLYAFRDNNNNGYLDLIANASSAWYLEPDVDTLEYVAYLESYSSNMTVSGFYFENSTYISVDQYGYVYNDSYIFNDTYDNEDWSFSYGPKPAPTTDTSAWFITPYFDNLTNTLTFSWGVTYTDFPVSFIDWNSWQEYQTYMDLEYTYDLRIEIQDNGTAAISIAQASNDTSTNETAPSDNNTNVTQTTAYIFLDTTYYFGELENATIRSKMNGLSLANVIDTSFYSETVVQETNASSSFAVGSSEMTFGSDGLKLGSIDVKGRKANYTLMDPAGNQTHQAQAAKIILFKESGSTTFNSTSLYEDHVSGDAETVITEETYRYDYQWVQGLLLISYPEWNGYGVVHDPTFSAVSVVSVGSGSGGDTSGGDDSTGGDDGSGGGSPDSSTGLPEDTKELPPPSTPIPGMELVAALVLLVTAAVFRLNNSSHSNRKRKQ